MGREPGTSQLFNQQTGGGEVLYDAAYPSINGGMIYS